MTVDTLHLLILRREWECLLQKMGASRWVMQPFFNGCRKFKPVWKGENEWWPSKEVPGTDKQLSFQFEVIFLNSALWSWGSAVPPAPFPAVSWSSSRRTMGRRKNKELGPSCGCLPASCFCQTHSPSHSNLFQGCSWTLSKIFPIQAHRAPSETPIPAAYTLLLRRIESQPHRTSPNSVTPIPAQQFPFLRGFTFSSVGPLFQGSSF